ncbi:hypothetical protein QM091_15350 [Enterobacter roggenkampii]|uniref:hypothetical protein n=1 Tax=Enterobacter roggenkampii TaxID=1812935 RepID=UPI002949F6C9|nr:hypothetical protein [Enterobacter roggenkampii]MDV5320218.1 hypothetical protein [Enterobacter roggenkampii]MDV5330166.1 hypothetical protein [Enterobacter roggenkampii]MDV5681156.1 hypothetical protein [Enterobacter roggenkampii]
MSVKRYELNGSSSIFENENGSLVDYDDYAALEARCAALAAEVYDLKHPGTYLPSKRETTTLDAFLAEVRASGVEMFADHLSGMNISASETSVREFAAQIRKGVQL